MEKTLRKASSRRHDIDWLRVLAIYSLFPIHVAIVFSALPFYHIRNSTVSLGMLVFLALVEPWIMPLFFVLAGWATFYSLRARGSRRFLKERVQKLLIPLVVGSVLFGPPIKYLELRSGFDANYKSVCSTADPTHRFGPCIPLPPPAPPNFGGREAVAPPFDEGFLEFWPTFFTQFDRFTWSQLWFLGYLFTLSLFYLPLFLWLIGIHHDFARAGAVWVYLPMIPLLLIEIILRPRWPGIQNLHNDWANFAYYSTLLVTGFLLAKYPAFEQALHREWKRALGISIVGMVLRVPSATGIIISPVLSYVGLVVAGWGAIVALIGFAHSRLTHTNAVLDYLGESAYPVYILHQVAVVGIGYGITQLPLAIIVKYAILLVASFAATLAAYELIVKRIPVLRFAFGMNPDSPEKSLL